jgi:hypothetical protein
MFDNPMWIRLSHKNVLLFQVMCALSFENILFILSFVV